MRGQIEYSKNQLQQYRVVMPIRKPTLLDTKPLPRTMQDALCQTSRAIVITEADKPFRVFDVNRTWESLCGFSFVESKGKTLGSLLRGDETDQLAATALISRLMNGEEAGAILTNYTKSGRRFRNRLRVGPIMNETNRITHFVGVLQEIQDGM
jgi:PAS domain S-box-containing protein